MPGIYETMVNLLSSDDLRTKGIKISRSQRYLLIQRGLFPKPIKIGLRSVAWPESEINAWINERMDAREEVAK